MNFDHKENSSLALYYLIFKKMLDCKSEQQYDDFVEEQVKLWYNISNDERKIMEEIILLFRLTQKAKNWVQDDELSKQLNNIIPPVNRDHIFPW